MLSEQNIRDAIANAVLNFDSMTLDPKMDFVDAGLDSLDLSSVLLELQEHQGFDVPDEDVDKCTSIQAMLDYAASRGN
ncbi:MAG: hypothetical protein A2516_08610 [Alphaproteobacteria bacterium RIFOXYD12_FULL_60_8]|nr:MAG: hypothetical protein A2516_08610 [Alphaproteobacteria bacterium RIFOXYD12_FULL_60_8]